MRSETRGARVLKAIEAGVAAAAVAPADARTPSVTPVTAGPPRSTQNVVGWRCASPGLDLKGVSIVSNDKVANEMRARHALLGLELNRLTRALWETAQWQAARDRVVTYLTETVLPHLQADETTVYPASRASLSGESVVQSMLLQNDLIRKRAAQLTAANDWRAATVLASRICQLFELHAIEENRFVIAALGAKGNVDLAGVVEAERDALVGAVLP